MSDKSQIGDKGIKRLSSISKEVSEKKLYAIPQENFNQSLDLLSNVNDPKELAKHLVKRIISDTESLMQILESIGYRASTVYTLRFPRYLTDVNRSFKLLSLELNDKLNEFVEKTERR